MKTESENLAARMQTVIDQKLEIACKICGIKPEETASRKKHINAVDLPGKKVYIYAERNTPLVAVRFGDDLIWIRRIRRVQWWYFSAKYWITATIKAVAKVWAGFKDLLKCNF